MLSYPSSCPQIPLRPGYTFQDTPYNAVSSGNGAVKRRRRSTMFNRVHRFKMACTVAERTSLEEFYTSLGNGAKRFSWLHPISGGETTMRFVSPPKYSGPLYDAYVSIELMEIA